MDSYRHVTVTEPSLKEGDRYNLHFERFALNPLAFDLATEASGTPVEGQIPLRFRGAAHAFAEQVDTLVERLSASKVPQARMEMARELVALHDDGRLLWPALLMIGISELAKVQRGLFRDAVLSKHPGLASIRDSFATEGTAGLGGNGPQRLRDMLKFVIGLRMASTARFTTSRDFRIHHFKLLTQIVKSGGVFHPSIPRKVATTFSHLGEHYRNWPQGFGNVTLGHMTSRLQRRSLVSRSVSEGTRVTWLAPAWQSWMVDKDVLDQAHFKSAFGLLNDFLSGCLPEIRSTAAAAFARPNMKALLDYAAGWSTPDQRKHALSKIRHFAEWLSTEGTDCDRPGFQVGLLQHDIVRSRAKWGSSDTVSRRNMTRPMPLPMHAMAKSIIAENDFAWPKSLTGSLSQWFAWHGPNGEVRQEFSPVMSRLLLLMLDLPIRGVQARRLDSGEGDDRRWDPKREAWFPNAGRHAGHWRRAGARNVTRGVIHEIVDQGRTITGLWINSNKTQDRQTLCDETSGYPIPWEDPGILNNLAEMRLWQETMNPVVGPLPHRELTKGLFHDDPTDLVAKHIPDRFYLFRQPLHPWAGGEREPPSRKELRRFFMALLEELERRWAEERPNDALKIILERKNGFPSVALFTIHGMRSATLTGLHQAGVPIGIVSKMVAGHASILMTLGYINYEPHHVSEIITAARVANDAREQEQLRAFLKRASFQEAMRRTAGVGEALPRSAGGGVDMALCSRLDIGICPNGGTRCAEGGPKQTRGRAETPGGPMNCVRCRFFRTGFPFLIPLWAKGNALLAEADGLARQAKKLDDEIVGLKGERAALRAEKSRVPEALDHRIRSLAEAHQQACAKRDARFDDFHVALELIEKVRALGPCEMPATAGANMLARSPTEVPRIGGRPASRYEVIDAVVHASRHYPTLDSPEIERERDGITDVIAFRNGHLPPSLAPLGRAEKRHAADALAKLFVSELDFARLDDLVDGRKGLSEHRGLEERFRRICIETTRTADPSGEGEVDVEAEGEGE